MWYISIFHDTNLLFVFVALFTKNFLIKQGKINFEQRKVSQVKVVPEE